MYSALIIDADADARFAIQNALEPHNFAFTSSDSAKDGLATASKSPVDIIFVRVELPSSSGFSVFNKLRRNAATQSVPVILYASDVADDVFDRHRGLRTHADGYLKLPVQHDELVQTVGKLVNLSSPAEVPAIEHTMDVELDEIDEIESADLDVIEMASEDIDEIELVESGIVETIEEPQTASSNSETAPDDDLDSILSQLTPEAAPASADLEVEAIDQDGQDDALLDDLEIDEPNEVTRASEAPSAPVATASDDDELELPSIDDELDFAAMENVDLDSITLNDATDLDAPEPDTMTVERISPFAEPAVAQEFAASLESPESENIVPSSEHTSSNLTSSGLSSFEQQPVSELSPPEQVPPAAQTRAPQTRSDDTPSSVARKLRIDENESESPTADSANSEPARIDNEDEASSEDMLLDDIVALEIDESEVEADSSDNSALQASEASNDVDDVELDAIELDDSPDEVATSDSDHFSENSDFQSLADAADNLDEAEELEPNDSLDPAPATSSAPQTSSNPPPTVDAVQPTSTPRSASTDSTSLSREAQTRRDESNEDDRTLARLAASISEDASGNGESSEAHARAAATSMGLPQRRELLNLKAQLVRKDRELIALRDELEQAQRSVLDERRGARDAQSLVAELEASKLALEEELLSAQEQVEAARQDRATTIRREDSLKHRLEVSQAKARQHEEELNQIKNELTARAEDLQRQNAALQEQLSGLQHESQRFSARTETLQSELEEAREDHARSVREREQLQGDLRQLQEEFDATKERFEQKLLQERAEAESTLKTRLEEMGAEWERRLEAQAEDYRGLLAQKEQEAVEEQSRAQKQLESAKQEADTRIQSLEDQLETRQIELQRLDTELQELRADRNALRDAKEEAEQRSQQEADQNATLHEELTSLRQDIAKLEATRQAVLENARRTQQAAAIIMKIWD